jgi:hypothetical protein
MFEKDSIKLFISVKIDSLNKENLTFDHLIAQKIKTLIEEKSKQTTYQNKKISVFLSSEDKEQDYLTENDNYRKSVQTALSDADALLFICSNVDFLNNSEHIKGELHTFFTLKDKGFKKKNSFFRITSREFDAQEKNIDKQLLGSLSVVNNFHPFKSKFSENPTQEIINEKADEFINAFNAIKVPSGNKLERFINQLSKLKYEQDSQEESNNAPNNALKIKDETELAYNLSGFEVSLKNWENNSETYAIIKSKEFDFKSIFEDDQFDLETLVELHAQSTKLHQEIIRIMELENSRIISAMNDMLLKSNITMNSIYYISSTLGTAVNKFKDAFRISKKGFFTKKIIESLKHATVKKNIKRFDNFKDSDINEIYKTFWGIDKKRTTTHIYNQNIKFTKLKGNRFGRKEISVMVIK